MVTHDPEGSTYNVADRKFVHLCGLCGSDSTPTDLNRCVVAVTALRTGAL